MKKKIFILTGITVSALVLACVLSSVLYVYNSSKNLKPGVDNSIIKIEREVVTIKEALPEVTKRAKKWHENAVLSHVMVELNGLEEIKSRRGSIICFISAKNVDYGFLQIGGAQAILTVDMKKNIISRFESYGAAKDINYGDEIDIDKMIDINDAFRYFVKEYNENIFEKYKNPVVSIDIGKERWFFELFESSNHNENLVRLCVDMQSGKIVEEQSTPRFK